MPKRQEIEVVWLDKPSSAAILRAHLMLLDWPPADIERAVAERRAEMRAKEEADERAATGDEDRAS
jgi:hypothetical protein